MEIKLSSIEFDQSTQCRAEMKQEVIDDYAEQMQAGDPFPPIDVYGTADKCWISDGWHRAMAARQNGSETISAIMHHGGRTEAIKAALSANAAHGLRRSNEDKRRAIEIACSEFTDLSNRAIADMCAVSEYAVRSHRPNCDKNAVEKTIGKDGKARPSTRKTPESCDQQSLPSETESDSPIADELQETSLLTDPMQSDYAWEPSEEEQQQFENIEKPRDVMDVREKGNVSENFGENDSEKLFNAKRAWIALSKSDRAKFRKWIESA